MDLGSNPGHGPLRETLDKGPNFPDIMRDNTWYTARA